MRKRSTKTKDSGGSYWTSFSDLFTTVAILFLVMFFVMVIQQAVMGHKIIKKNKEVADFIDAKMTTEEEVKAKEVKENLEGGIAALDNYQEKVRKQIEDLSFMQGDIKAYQKDISSLLENNRVKSAFINSLSEIKKKLELNLNAEVNKNNLNALQLEKLSMKNSSLSQENIELQHEVNMLKEQISQRIRMIENLYVSRK